MPYHRYKVGQTVVAPSGVRDALIPSGPYVIVRLLPLVDREPHYRVKSTVDGHERALLEGQIRPIVQEPERKEPAPPRSIRGVGSGVGVAASAVSWRAVYQSCTSTSVSGRPATSQASRPPRYQ